MKGKEMKVGDVVTLKGSPSPKMTVNRSATGGWECLWFINGTLYRDVFAEETLAKTDDK
jgi:uncharacterized protein YodC (DUF2158 family)